MITIRRGQIPLERGRIVQDLSINKERPTPAVIMGVIDDSTIFGRAFHYRVASYNLTTGAIFPENTWKVVPRKQVAFDRRIILPEDMVEEGLQIGKDAYGEYLRHVGEDIAAWMRRSPEENWKRLLER